MKTRAAICWEIGRDWSVEEIDLDPPRGAEVLVRMVASGLCHSDEHVLTGDLRFDLPMVGGHEGAGVVEALGPDVHGLEVGDHVVFGFIPACGRCPSCASGHENLCDLGAWMAAGLQVGDHTSRHHCDGRDLTTMCMLGTFAEHTVVHEASCIRVEDHVDLRTACLLGCGVVTGWGSAVYAAQVTPGDSVAVVGIGGIGINAVQGARLAGAEMIMAIDPVPWKLERAVAFGATHTFASLAEAAPAIRELTWGRNCDKVILTVGVGRGDMIGPALRMTAKRGRVVVTNIHPVDERTVSMSAIDLTLSEKQVVGSIYGSANPRVDIPKLLRLHGSGQLMLDEVVTRTYRLDGVNQGYEDMRAGRNLRGVLHFD
jgi:NDMA-dependent alcohol dehydrogenase